MTAKLAAGSIMPRFALPTVQGAEVTVGQSREGRYQLVVIYRGQHCPICKTYLRTLDGMIDDFSAASTDVVAVSGDSAERATATVKEIATTKLAVAFDLAVAQMRQLGLYISEPRPSETDRPFPEPALFLMNPHQQAQIIDISNAPFARPDLAMVLRGVRRIQEVAYPIRGTLA